MKWPGRQKPVPDAVPVELGPMLAEPRRALGWAGAILAVTAVLFLLVWFDATAEVIQRIDDRWLRLMVDLRWPPLVTVAKVLSFIGGTWCTWAIRIAVFVVLAMRRSWLSLSAFALAVVVSEALIGPLKALYDRPRPLHPLVTSSGASFPSGHAVAAAVTAVGIVIALLPPGHTRWVWERRAALYASLIALSRTYLGVHWLSDVVAGALLGSGIALLCPALLVDLRVRVNARRAQRQVQLE
jgi:membrane-associated phospholipid phosphatase